MLQTEAYLTKVNYDSKTFIIQATGCQAMFTQALCWRENASGSDSGCICHRDDCKTCFNMISMAFPQQIENRNSPWSATSNGR